MMLSRTRPAAVRHDRACNRLVEQHILSILEASPGPMNSRSITNDICMLLPLATLYGKPDDRVLLSYTVIKPRLEWLYLHGFINRALRNSHAQKDGIVWTYIPDSQHTERLSR